MSLPWLKPRVFGFYLLWDYGMDIICNCGELRIIGLLAYLLNDRCIYKWCFGDLYFGVYVAMWCLLFYFIVSLSITPSYKAGKRENVSSTSGICGRCLRVTKKICKGSSRVYVGVVVKVDSPLLYPTRSASHKLFQVYTAYTVYSLYDSLLNASAPHSIPRQ